MSSYYLPQKEKLCNKHFTSKMQKNAAVFTIVCIMMCLTFNYTFPLHREISGSAATYYPNETEQCDIPVHHESIVDRTKKMASNIEHAFKRIKDSTQDFGKNIYERVNGGGFRKNLSDDDLRHYEQLVIMKKNPYLDIKELELEYRPSDKNARQSLKSAGPNLGNDPSICEPVEDGPNVEITNRGLSGFAIPPQLTRLVMDSKTKLTKDEKDENIAKVTRKSSLKDVLGSLNDDVKQYVQWKNRRNV